MICLNTLADVAGIISDSDLDDDLRALIAHRGWQAYADHPSHLSKDTRIVVVQGGDTPDVINTAVGFPIAGDDAEEPTYDTLADHGLWFEIVYRGRCGRERHQRAGAGEGAEAQALRACYAMLKARYAA